jgi:hypothetical protein
VLLNELKRRDDKSLAEQIAENLLKQNERHHAGVLREMQEATSVAKMAARYGIIGAIVGALCGATAEYCFNQRDTARAQKPPLQQAPPAIQSESKKARGQSYNNDNFSHGRDERSGVLASMRL